MHEVEVGEDEGGSGGEHDEYSREWCCTISRCLNQVQRSNLNLRDLRMLFEVVAGINALPVLSSQPLIEF